MTSRLWQWSALRGATANALLMSVACGAFLGRSAMCQTMPARAVKGIGAVDSLVSAEFAKDSIGSITVGVIAGSQLAWTRSVGFADMKTRRMANRNTVYRIGSITKPFTAVMLMQMVAAGKVRLSDPVERYLPEVKEIASRPPGAAPFTFLQLATMTAGLAREPDDAGPFWTGPVSAWEKTLLAALPHTSYQSFPGTAYSYSNIGYAILGAALARVAGQPYTEWERSHVFRPLGMDRTRFEVDRTIESDLAVGYEVRDDGTLDDQTAADEARDGRGYKVPNGAIFTTVDDLSRFVAFELGRGPDSVLARPSLTDAFEGVVATDAGEAAVRRLIGELRVGKPDYDLMSAGLAQLTRRRLTQEQATFAKLGALQSLTFKGVGASGPNIFLATFDKGSLEWRIWLNLDGSVDYFIYRAVPPPKQ